MNKSLCFLCQSNRIRSGICIDCEANQQDAAAYQIAIRNPLLRFQCPIITDVRTWKRCSHTVPASTMDSYRCPECQQHVNKVRLFFNNRELVIVAMAMRDE